jgi:hypothetical protein
MPKTSDMSRAEAVTAYLRGTATQAEFCAAFQSRTGHPLSPRTLRAWIARLSASGVDVRARDLLADALDQVRALEARLQAALDQLDGDAAAPMPVQHMGACHGGLPLAATVAPASAAATGQPLGIKEGSATEEMISTGFSWD